MRSGSKLLSGSVIILLLLILLFTFCCKGEGKKPGRTSFDTDEGLIDSTSIFDGKTLEGWAVTEFGPQGPVYISGNTIVLGMGEGCTGITYQKDFPRIDYKLTLEARRISGTDFFCGITFPVEEDYCSFIVGGWGGAVVGLSSINRMDASENETTTYMNFEKDRWYDICLIVKEDSIKATIDNDVVVDFAIGSKVLSIRPEVELSKPFGITSWTTTAALRNIRVKRLNNKD